MKSGERTFSVDRAEDSTGFLLWQVTNLWQREIRKALEPFELTHSQFVLLASIHWLTLHDQEVTQILLSHHTKIDPMTTSTVLRAMQAKLLIRRREHSTDTRAKTVVLTEKSVNTAKRAVKAVEKFDREFFSRLGPGVVVFNTQILTLLTG